jgi:uncharacterized repeat protein (TIGR03806 family)
MPTLRLSVALLVLALLPGCATGPNLDGDMPYDTLSEYGLFSGELALLEPSGGVLPFDPIAPLWSDGSSKSRHLAVPDGEAVTFDPVGPWEFPLRSVVEKSFATSDGVPVETRLLVHLDSGWEAYTYVWDADAQDAVRLDGGDVLTVDLGAGEQEFQVPSQEECGYCHDRDGEAFLLAITGPQSLRQVERGSESVDQVDWLAEQGLFGDVAVDTSTIEPLVDPYADGALEPRARSYLDANCAHCHRAGARADVQGLRFLATEADLEAVGVCRTPAVGGVGSGGLSDVIVPGEPDASVLVYRMEATSLGICMPEFVRLIDTEGVDLIADWIAAMEPTGCD